jgi:hypothetical protein
MEVQGDGRHQHRLLEEAAFELSLTEKTGFG